MASVYKHKRKGDFWYAAWNGHNGERKTKCTLTTDKAAALRIAKKYETDAALRGDGVIDASQDRYATEGRRELSEHLADYTASLTAKSRDADYVRWNESRARLVIDKCKAKYAADLTPSAVQRAVGELRDGGASLATCNTYLRSIKGFTKWLARDRRTRTDELAYLELYNEATDRRLERRVLTADELERLYAAAAAYVGPRTAVSGPDREMLYRVAAGTGFRAGELRSLTLESFQIDADEPTITVEATHSKRRRTDVQPIRRDLAELLKPWLAGKPAGKPVFVNMPKNHTARMLRRDLAAAREAWIKDATGAELKRRQKSDFLSYRNDAGQVADFHATRHTYVSNIVASGATVREAQELARHSSPTLTIGRYAHAERGNLRRVLELGPNLGQRQGQRAGVEMVRNSAINGDATWPLDAAGENAKGGKKPRKTAENAAKIIAEGTGLEPATPCGAPHFQCGR